MRIEFEGVDKLNAALSRAVAKVPQATNQFLMKEAELLKGRAAMLTPVDTGRLRYSWQRTEPSGGMVEVYNNTEYAQFVEFPHRQFVYGKYAGYIQPGRFMLRDAVDETAKNFAADCQAIMRSIFG